MHKIKNVRFKYFTSVLGSDTENVFFFLEPFMHKNNSFKEQALLKRSFFVNTVQSGFLKTHQFSGGGSLIKWVFKLKGGFRDASVLLKKTASILYINSFYLSSCKMLEIFLNMDSEKLFTHFLLALFKPSLTKSSGTFCCTFGFIIRKYVMI